MSCSPLFLQVSVPEMWPLAPPSALRCWGWASVLTTLLWLLVRLLVREDARGRQGGLRGRRNKHLYRSFLFLYCSAYLLELLQPILTNWAVYFTSNTWFQTGIILTLRVPDASRPLQKPSTEQDPSSEVKVSTPAPHFQTSVLRYFLPFSLCSLSLGVIAVA